MGTTPARIALRQGDSARVHIKAHQTAMVSEPVDVAHVARLLPPSETHISDGALFCKPRHS
jgi:hypothetical protein